MKEFVAVYGSLRKGFGNNRLLSSAEFLGDGATIDHFTMHSLGGFPCIVEDGNCNVAVEVYAVDNDTFERLDMLEGYPDFYNRKLTEICLFSGEQVKCWVYYMDQDNAYIRPNSEVESGDWKEFKQGY